MYWIIPIKYTLWSKVSIIQCYMAYIICLEVFLSFIRELFQLGNIFQTNSVIIVFTSPIKMLAYSVIRTVSVLTTINTLSPDMKMHILLTVLHTFGMKLVSRICLNIKTSHPWWLLPLFSSLECLNKQW